MARGAAVHRPIISIVPLALIASLAIATALAYGFAMHFTPGAGLPGWMLLAGGIAQALILAALIPLTLRHARNFELLAKRDALTGLPNRAGLHAEFAQIAALADGQEEIGARPHRSGWVHGDQ